MSSTARMSRELDQAPANIRQGLVAAPSPVAERRSGLRRSLSLSVRFYTYLNPDVKAPLKDAANIVLLFEPQPSPVVFAFLGAYIFALQYLLRSYLRADLRPKSYTHVTVRIFVAVIFAWVLEQLYLNVPSANPKQDSLLVAAFVVGVLPETLLVRLQEAARRIAGGRNRTRLPMLYERYPLTELEGIDIYDRTRLLDEGVGNIEGLAHHNLPELMMQTRIPVARLVYWTDQAILYLHTATTVEGTGKGTNATSSDQVRSEANSGTARLRILQEHGIHTATDLKNAYEGAKKRTCEKEKAGEQHAGDGELNAFLALLGSEGPVNGARVYRLQAILDAIEDEEWMQNLEHWHAHGCHSSKTLILRNGDLSEGVERLYQIGRSRPLLHRGRPDSVKARTELTLEGRKKKKKKKKKKPLNQPLLEPAAVDRLFGEVRNLRGHSRIENLPVFAASFSRRLEGVREGGVSLSDRVPVFLDRSGLGRS